MHTDTLLIGRWDSGIYDLGSMEASEVALLADGGGWTMWHNAAGGLSVTGLRWWCPEPRRLAIREVWQADGQWQPDGPDQWRSFRLFGDAAKTTVTAYRIDRRTEYRGVGPFVALHTAEPVEGIRSYQKRTRHVSPSECRAYDLICGNTPLPRATS